MTFAGHHVKLARHGFARKQEWKLLSQGENELAMCLASEDNAALLSDYPYPFRLVARYTLEDAAVRVSYEVTNEGAEDMPFFIGGHPGFRCPLDEGEAYADYELRFEKDEAAELCTAVPSTGLIDVANRSKNPMLGKTLPLSHELFDFAETIFDVLESRQVTLSKKGEDKGVRLSFEGFPYLIVWSKPEGDFVAVEPGAVFRPAPMRTTCLSTSAAAYRQAQRNHRALVHNRDSVVACSQFVLQGIRSLRDKELEMILTVTMNPSVDTRYQLDELIIDDVNRVTPEKTAGGKGLNVARVLGQLGDDVVATGLLGGHMGAYMAELMDANGIKNDFVPIKGETRICLNILHAGNQTELLESGPTIAPEELDAFTAKFAELASKADVVTISGSLPRGVEADYYAKITGIAENAGAKVLLDTSGASLELRSSPRSSLSWSSLT